MLESTKKGLCGLVVDCVRLLLVGLCLLGLMSFAGCAPQESPKLIYQDRTDSMHARVVELDHDSISGFVILKVRMEAPGIQEAGAIAPVGEGLELNDKVRLYWTEIFNTTNAPYGVNHFRRATKIGAGELGPSN